MKRKLFDRNFEGKNLKQSTSPLQVIAVSVYCRNEHQHHYEQPTTDWTRGVFIRDRVCDSERVNLRDRCGERVIRSNFILSAEVKISLCLHSPKLKLFFKICLSIRGLCI